MVTSAKINSLTSIFVLILSSSIHVCAQTNGRLTHKTAPNERKLANSENNNIYGGVVLPKETETVRVQKRLKLKGCCIPDRIFTDEERVEFETMIFTTLQKRLACDSDKTAEHVKRLETCFEMTSVHVESESLVQHSKGNGQKPKNSLETIVTFEAHTVGDSSQFASYVANNLAAVLTKMTARKDSKSANREFFNGVEDLEVYAWRSKISGSGTDSGNNGQQPVQGGSYVVQRNKSMGSGYLYNVESSSSERNNNEQTETSFSAIKSQDQQASRFVQSATFNVLIVSGIVFLSTLTVVFLRSNSKKSRRNLHGNDIEESLEATHMMSTRNKPVMSRVKKSVQFQGIMDDHDGNSYDAEDREYQ